MTRIPLSKSFAQSPWPIAAFQLMVKTVGPACGLACDYCYYLHKAEQLQLGGFDLMDDELLETFIRQYIQSVDDASVFFIWQGGEPTLAGIDFFRKALSFQKKYARLGQKMANLFQTNGILLDDEWCRFLAEGKFLVGISIDGPAAINDAYRKTAAGKSSFDQVVRALALLQKHNVPHNTLTTVTPANVEQPEELYAFLTRQTGSTSVQFQPCAERKDFCTVAPGKWNPETMPVVGSDAARPGHPTSIMADWSISAEAWGTFLCRLFDLWRSEGQRSNITLFDSWASQAGGGTALVCTTSPICGRSLTIERDGRVFSCEHFVYDEYCIGNINQQPLSQIVRSARQRAFGEAKTKSLPQYCRDCKFLSLCYGECPKRRFLRTPDGEPGLNYFCPGLRQFFSHAGNHLAERGRMIASRRIRFR